VPSSGRERNGHGGCLPSRGHHRGTTSPPGDRSGGSGCSLLAQDSYEAAEVPRQVAASRRALLRRLASLFGFHSGNTDAVQWWRGGKRFDLPTRGGFSVVLSAICDNQEYRVYAAPLGIEPRQQR